MISSGGANPVTRGAFKQAFFVHQDLLIGHESLGIRDTG